MHCLSDFQRLDTLCAGKVRFSCTTSRLGTNILEGQSRYPEYQEKKSHECTRKESSFDETQEESGNQSTVKAFYYIQIIHRSWGRVNQIADAHPVVKPVINESTPQTTIHPEIYVDGLPN